MDYEDRRSGIVRFWVSLGATFFVTFTVLMFLLPLMDGCYARR